MNRNHYDRYHPRPQPGSIEAAPARPRSAQNKIIEAYITDAKKFLMTFIKELKGTARGALRGKPGLLAKLEL